MGANRQLNQGRYSLLKGLTDVFAVVNVGAGGAVTLQQWIYPSLGTTAALAYTYSAAPTTGGSLSWPGRTAQGEAGIYSVARTAAGLWTVTFQDFWDRLVGLSFFSRLAGGLSAVVAVHENTTITAMSTQANGGSIVGVALL